MSSCLGSVTARHSSSGRQPNFVAFNRGRHLYLTGRPSRWALAHILVYICFEVFYLNVFLVQAFQAVLDKIKAIKLVIVEIFAVLVLVAHAENSELHGCILFSLCFAQ